MDTVLVTGGAGFIGSNLCEKLLELGFRVVNIDNFNNYYAPSIKRRNVSKALIYPGYTLIEGHVLDPDILKACFNIPHQVGQESHMLF